jgi:hypothetical protein
MPSFFMMRTDLITAKIKVVAYSGYRANERPLYFRDGEKHSVKRVLNQWRDPDYDCFEVLSDDGVVYVLKWHRSMDAWYVSS